MNYRRQFRAPYGFVAREGHQYPWILWHSWPEWRFGKRAPEHVVFKDYRPYKEL